MEMESRKGDGNREAIAKAKQKKRPKAREMTRDGNNENKTRSKQANPKTVVLFFLAMARMSLIVCEPDIPDDDGMCQREDAATEH